MQAHTNIRKEQQHLQKNVPAQATASNAAVQLRDNRPEASLQKKQVTALANKETNPVQRKVIKTEHDELSVPMKKRLNEAYERFNSAILSSSFLAEGDKNVVEICGVTSKTFGVYGVTYIHINNVLEEADNPDHFIELWDMDPEKKIDKDAVVKITIAVNLSTNTTMNQLYVTLLHEWNAHALKWEKLIRSIRAGNNMPEKIQGLVTAGHKVPDGLKSYVLRGDHEHKKYANKTDNQLMEMIDTLKLEETGLNGEALKKRKVLILNTMKLKDRDTYNKKSGKAIWEDPVETKTNDKQKSSFKSSQPHKRIKTDEDK